MNILIPHSWLKDYVKTDLTGRELAKKLSLHALNVEKTTEIKGDEIWEIEVTANRGDCLSVLGVARELTAVFEPKDLKLQIEKISAPKISSDKDNLAVEIREKSLVPRFSAIVLDEVKIKESPSFMRERLEKVGIRPLNNIVDITNYLMIDKGQPMHAFDFEKIKGAKMILRESRDGEKITTLDNAQRVLPQGVIVIEDGAGRLIDLCGIMGAKNSEIDEKTRKVLLFVQVYDPIRIRKASMTLGHRTEAALRFEKGIDFEGVLPALWEATALAQKYAGAKISSRLIDIVNEKQKTKEIEINYQKINSVAGLEIEKAKVDQILKKLGFEIKGKKARVPSWRINDIEIAEDLAEEAVRILGYHNIPSELPQGEIPRRKMDEVFFWEDKIKDFLRYAGFFECYNYSAAKKEDADKNSLALVNFLTEKMTHLRTSLLPQLVEVLDKNQSFGEKTKIFELSNAFLPQENDLPYQPLMLGLAAKGEDYLNFKGILEALILELGIKPSEINLEIQKDSQGYLKLEINFEELVKKASRAKKYAPFSQFNSIKEDLTLAVPPGADYRAIEKTILASSVLIKKLEFEGLFKNFLTLSIEYLDSKKQISSEDSQKIRKDIFDRLEKELGVKLKE